MAPPARASTAVVAAPRSPWAVLAHAPSLVMSALVDAVLQAILAVLAAILPAPWLARLAVVVATKRGALTKTLGAVLAGVATQKWIVPAVAQKLLDASHMAILAMTMQSPTPKSVQSGLTAQLRDTGPLPTVLKMTKPMRILYKDRVVALASVPRPTSVPPNGGIVNMDADMQIADADGMAQFCTDLVMARDEVPFTMSGDGGITIALFNGHVLIPGLSLTKTVSLRGMAGLADMTIESVDLVDSTATDLIMECVCTVMNPAPVAMNSGTVRFTMTTPALVASDPDAPPIAHVAMPDMTLVPGMNRLSARCSMPRPHPATVAHHGARQAGIRLLSRFLTNRSSPVLVRGDSADAAPYLTPAIRAVQVATVLPPMPPMPLLIQTTMQLSQVSLVAQIAPAKLTMCNPFAVPMTITRMRGGAYVSRDAGSSMLSPPPAMSTRRASSSAGSTSSRSSTTSGTDPLTPSMELVPSASASNDDDEDPLAPPYAGAPCMGTFDAHVMLYVPGFATVTCDEPVPMGLQLGLAQLRALAASGGSLKVDCRCVIDCRVGQCVLAGVPYRQDGVAVLVTL
ncbi:hypothetical protein GGF32_002602 [Allomyces javanicus]|nr:hypothetical protein GGF32_002602 [Allomyces javanicus]